jgi:hypothetical protein
MVCTKIRGSNRNLWEIELNGDGSFAICIPLTSLSKIASVA